MFKIFTYIDYALKVKQGVERPDELLSETGFGFIELYFYLSFAVLALVAGILGFLAYRYSSVGAGIFSFLFVLVLIFDIWIFNKLKSFFDRASKKIVEVGKEAFRKKEAIEVEVLK